MVLAPAALTLDSWFDSKKSTVPDLKTRCCSKKWSRNDEQIEAFNLALFLWTSASLNTRLGDQQRHFSR
jgi:hypothetical protein